MKKYLIKLLIFVTIALFAILFVEVFSTIIKVPKISYQNIYAKGQNLIPQINSNTILFLGDSRIEWGVKPIVINNILNNKDDINVINMALPNSNGLDILTYLKSKNIYPKLIILGYTSNYGRYTNHDLDKIEYSNRNRIEERFKYFLKQNSFIYDYNSIKEYLLGRHPINISHEYDSLGGVNVTLYGNYQSKKEFQIKIYTEWSKDFSKDKLKAYYLSVKKFKQWFSKGGTKIYGLSMPASYDIINLEHKNNIDQNASELFDKYYDFSILNQTIVDSIYFLDGSHLSKKLAISFSEQFAEKLKIENN
jgi:hypothetical protein